MSVEIVTLGPNQWREHFGQLYGRRNRAFIPQRSRLISHLAVAIGNLAGANRKGLGTEALESAIASVFGWTMAVANSFESDLPLSAAMDFKWGGENCLYCSHAPCDCPEDRPKVERSFNPALGGNHGKFFTIGQYQVVLKHKYLERNKNLGLVYAFGRLFEELGEVIALDAEVAIDQPTVEEIEYEYALELADILGWLISICNLFDIDLETAVSKVYGRSCSECTKRPCACGRLVLDQGRFRRAKPFTSA